MNKFLEGLVGWFRRTFGPSEQESLEMERRECEARRKQLTDARERLNREATDLETVLREKFALSKSMTGTALTTITNEMNLQARELQNLRDSLTDLNNRIAAEVEKIGKIGILMRGANDLEEAVGLETMLVKLEMQRENSAMVGAAFASVVASAPVSDHVATAGLGGGVETFAAPAAASRPAVDPLILDLAGEHRAPATPPSPAGTAPAAALRRPEDPRR